MASNAFLIPLMHILIFMIGAGIGSFLNVVIYRVPLGMSVNNPKRSFCFGCKQQIPWYHNLPLISWLMLRGQCGNCGSKIAFRYFFVELLTALLFYAAFRHVFAAHGENWQAINEWGPWLIALWVFLSLLIAGTFIDIDHLILPHGITMGGAFAGLVLSWCAPQLHSEDSHNMSLTMAFFAAVAGIGALWTVVLLGKLFFGRLKHTFTEPAPWSIGQPDDTQPPVFTIRIEGEDVPHAWEDIFYRERDRLVITCDELQVNDRTWTNAVAEVTMDVLRVKTDVKSKGEEIAWDGVKKLGGTTRNIVIPREAMGMGDVWFIGMIGAFCGWKGVVFTIFAASILGVVCAVVPRIFGKQEWTARIPFGPYLAAAAVLWVFFGPQLWDWYWAMSGFRGAPILD